MNSTEEKSMLKDAIVTECANAMSELQRTWQLWESKDNEVPEFFKIAQCIVQMICLKTNTILKMTEGISLVKGTNRIVDFSSILPVIRSAYELCFMFRNIFISTETKEELDILLSIWKIRGLSCRQNFRDIPVGLLEKGQKEKEEIDKLRNDIIGVIARLDISEKARNDINGILRYEGDNIKGFVFVKENGKIIEIRNIHFVDGLQILPQFQNTLALYKWTSMHAHASYLSVLQFGQAYTSKRVDNAIKTNLTSAYLICKTVLSDYKTLIQRYTNL